MNPGNGEFDTLGFKHIPSGLKLSHYGKTGKNLSKCLGLCTFLNTKQFYSGVTEWAEAEGAWGGAVGHWAVGSSPLPANLEVLYSLCQCPLLLVLFGY